MRKQHLQIPPILKNSQIAALTTAELFDIHGHPLASPSLGATVKGRKRTGESSPLAKMAAGGGSYTEPGES